MRSKRLKMANTIESDILRVLTDTKDAIQASMQAQRINASGRTSASMRVDVYEGGMRLVGGTNGQRSIPESPGIYGSETAPIPTLEFGREGGKVPRGFYYIIRDWSRAKGLRFASDIERNTFSYFVARKIAREGTRRNTDNADVYSTPVSNAKERINAILQQSVAKTVRAAIGGENVTSLRGAFS